MSSAETTKSMPAVERVFTILELLAGSKRGRSTAEKVRKSGFAVDDEEEEIGLRCIGAPVFDADGGVVAAISIAGPTSQIHAGNLAMYASKVKNTAAWISRMIGFQPRAAAASIAS